MAIGYKEKTRLIECLRAFADRSKLKCIVDDDCMLSGKLDIQFLTSAGDLVYREGFNQALMSEDDIPKTLSKIFGATAYMLPHRIRSGVNSSVNTLYDSFKEKPSIKKVIFNAPATIVMWSDGSKTVVKCSEGEVYDPEKGLAMAMAKKMLGNEGNYYNEFKKWLPKEDE